MLCKELVEQLNRIPDWVWNYFVETGHIPEGWDPWNIVEPT